MNKFKPLKGTRLEALFKERNRAVADLRKIAAHAMSLEQALSTTAEALRDIKAAIETGDTERALGFLEWLMGERAMPPGAVPPPLPKEVAQ